MIQKSRQTALKCVHLPAANVFDVTRFEQDWTSTPAITVVGCSINVDMFGFTQP